MNTLKINFQYSKKQVTIFNVSKKKKKITSHKLDRKIINLLSIFRYKILDLINVC